MKRTLPAWLVLAIIAIAAGMLLGLTNELTAKQIEEQTLLKADEARRSVLPDAVEFSEVPLAAGAPVDNCYEGKAGDVIVGYTAQVTAKGYGGEIEVIVGMSGEGVITGVNVGGPSFSETAGLGAKAKEPAFTEQFRGITPPVAAGGNIDGLTGATITTTAVTGAVNTGVEYIRAELLAK